MGRWWHHNMMTVMQRRLPVKIFGAVTGRLPVDDGPLALTLFCTFCCLYTFMMVSPCCRTDATVTVSGVGSKRDSRRSAWPTVVSGLTGSEGVRGQGHVTVCAPLFVNSNYYYHNNNHYYDNNNINTMTNTNNNNNNNNNIIPSILLQVKK